MCIIVLTGFIVPLFKCKHHKQYLHKDWWNLSRFESGTKITTIYSQICNSLASAYFNSNIKTRSNLDVCDQCSSIGYFYLPLWHLYNIILCSEWHATIIHIANIILLVLVFLTNLIYKIVFDQICTQTQIYWLRQLRIYHETITQQPRFRG